MQNLKQILLLSVFVWSVNDGLAQSTAPYEIETVESETGIFYQAAESECWWRSGYLLDYALIVGGTAGYIIGEDIQSQSNSLIGPSYNPEDRFEFVGDERFSERCEYQHEL